MIWAKSIKCKKTQTNQNKSPNQPLTQGRKKIPCRKETQSSYTTWLSCKWFLHSLSGHSYLNFFELVSHHLNGSRCNFSQRAMKKGVCCVFVNYVQIGQVIYLCLKSRSGFRSKCWGFCWEIILHGALVFLPVPWAEALIVFVLDSSRLFGEWTALKNRGNDFSGAIILNWRRFCLQVGYLYGNFRGHFCLL